MSFKQQHKPMDTCVATRRNVWSDAQDVEPIEHASPLIDYPGYEEFRIQTREDVLQLQSRIGNRRMRNLLRDAVQRQKARSGDQITSTRRKANGDSGDGLPEDLRDRLEALSGISLEDVKVYRNSSKPHALGACSYAEGSNIYLAPGQESNLPHEGWHVVQQKREQVLPTMQINNFFINDDELLEEEADRMASRALQMKPPAPRTRERTKETATPINSSGWSNGKPHLNSQSAPAPVQRIRIHRTDHRAKEMWPRIHEILKRKKPNEKDIQFCKSMLWDLDKVKNKSRPRRAKFASYDALASYLINSLLEVRTNETKRATKKAEVPRLIQQRRQKIDSFSDEQLIGWLRLQQPTAKIQQAGDTIAINGVKFTMELLRNQLVFSPDWVVDCCLRRKVHRRILAENPLQLPTQDEQKNLIEIAREDIGDTNSKKMLNLLGPVSFAMLIADLAQFKGALATVVGYLDFDKAHRVVDRIGAHGFAGILFEHRDAPGRLILFVEDLLSSDIRHIDGPTKDTLILDHTLADMMNRLAIEIRNNQDEEFVLRPRLAEEKSMVASMQRMYKQGIAGRGSKEVKPMKQVAISMLGHSRGKGKQMVFSHDAEHDRQPSPLLLHALGNNSANVLKRIRKDIRPHTGGSSETMRTLPVTDTDRKQETYDEILRTLYGLRIRDVRRAELAEIADVFLAAKQAGTTLTFASSSKALLDALGERAGYDMVERKRSQTYGQFFAMKNIQRHSNNHPTTDCVDPALYGVPSLAVHICGATVDVVPIERVIGTQPTRTTTLMELANANLHAPVSDENVDRGLDGPKVYAGMIIEYRKHSENEWRRGMLYRYHYDDKIDLIKCSEPNVNSEGTELEERRNDPSDSPATIRVSTQTHALRVPCMQPRGVSTAPTSQVRFTKSMEEVENLFGDSKISARLSAMSALVVASEVVGIKLHPVKDYLDVIKQAGFKAYIVGGAVRDSVSGLKEPADIDVSTSMPAKDVYAAIRGASLGHPRRAERMPMVRRIPFRGLMQVEWQIDDGLDIMTMRTEEHGVFGLNIIDDIQVRDFTINALYYNPYTHEIEDPTGRGLDDLKYKRLRWVWGGGTNLKAKLKKFPEQIRRWIKFRITKDMFTPDHNDAAVVSEALEECLNEGIPREKVAYMINGMGCTPETAIEKANHIGIPDKLLKRLFGLIIRKYA